MLQKREKVLLLRTFQGRTLRIVREHYLRPSVPCNSPLCTQPAACRNGQGLGGRKGGRGGDEEPRGRVLGEPWTPGSEGVRAGVVRPVRRKGASGGAARGQRGAESKAPGLHRSPPSPSSRPWRPPWAFASGALRTDLPRLLRPIK